MEEEENGGDDVEEEDTDEMTQGAEELAPLREDTVLVMTGIAAESVPSSRVVVILVVVKKETRRTNTNYRGFTTARLLLYDGSCKLNSDERFICYTEFQ